MTAKIEHKSSPLDEPVDAQRNQRHATFVTTEFLRDRLNPTAYRPEILEALSVLKSRFKLVRLAEFCSAPIQQGTTPEYGDGGAPCLKVGDIEPMLPNQTPKARVSLAFHSANLAARIGRDTVLITRSGEGSLGRSSVYLRDEPVFVSDHVFACAVAEDEDSSFLVAYLNSWWGKRAIEIGIVGSTGQLGLSQSHVRDLPIPDVSDAIARAIGNKIRKAERLREIAEDAQASFMCWLATATELHRLSSVELGFLEHIPSNTCRDKVWVTDFDLADRVDPWPYHIAPRTIRGHLRQLTRARFFHDLFAVVTDARPRISPPVAPNCYHLSILDIDAVGRIDWDNAAKTRYDGQGVTIHPGDILYSTLNPQETRIGYIPRGRTGAIVASPEFSTLRLREEFADYPYLATAVLRSNWVRVQASFLTRSSSLSRRRLAEGDLAKILVPWNEDGSSELEKKVALASDAYIQAGVLIDQAKADVESLISNTLDLDALHAESAVNESWLAANPSPVASKN